MSGILVIGIIVVLLWIATKQIEKHGEERHRTASEATKHLPSFLRECTGVGPWLEMDDFYRNHNVDLKCTSCSRDTIFVSNANPVHETEFIDVHFKAGKLRIMYGNRVLFDGDPLNVMAYPLETFPLRADSPPPKESGSYYSIWVEHFKNAVNQGGQNKTTVDNIPLIHEIPHSASPEERNEQFPKLDRQKQTTHPTAGPSKSTNAAEGLYLAFAQKDGNKLGYIDKTGEFIIAPKFANAWQFSEGLAAVELERAWGCIDLSGELVIDPQFGSAFSFYKGLANVNQNGVWGYIDKGGSWVIAPRFEGALQFFDGLAAAKLGGKWGYVDGAGRFVIAPRFDWTWHFWKGLAAVTVNGGVGYIDITGRLVIPARFEEARNFSNGLANVKLSGKWGKIDETGSFAIAPQFDMVFGFCDGLAAVELDGRWGYIDVTGKLVIPAKFEMASSFSEGLAAVKMNGTKGYINKAGETVIRTQFRQARGFYGGLAAFELNGVWGCIDQTGEVVIAPQFQQLDVFLKAD